MQRKTTEDFIGTCQACFGEFKVNENDQKVVLHGYKRPGDGMIHGECQGTGHAPFEYDTALTVQIIAAHRAASDKAGLRRAKLEAGEILKLTRTYEEWNRDTGRSITKSEIVEPGHQHWESTLRAAKADAARMEQWHHDFAEYLQKMVDAWTRGQIVGIDVPATGKPKTPRGAYDPIEAKAMEERAAIKAARDAKPGKLSVIFYRPALERPGPVQEVGEEAWRAWRDADDADEKAYAALIKTWVKANITGKTLVRPQIGDYDLPRKIRETGDYNVVTVSLPWEYLDQINTLFPNAQPLVNEKKKKSFTVFGEPQQGDK